MSKQLKHHQCCHQKTNDGDYFLRVAGYSNQNATNGLYLCRQTKVTGRNLHWEKGLVHIAPDFGHSDVERSFTRLSETDYLIPPIVIALTRNY